MGRFRQTGASSSKKKSLGTGNDRYRHSLADPNSSPLPERFKNSLDDGAGNQQSRKGSDADAGKRKRLKSQLESPLEAPLQEHLGDVKPKPQIGEEIVEKPEARHENPYFHSPFGRLQ